MNAVAERPAITLLPDEIVQVTGGYKQPAAQLAELHRQGFWRARRSKVTGAVVLERAHHEAVCAGQDGVTPGGRRTALHAPKVLD